MIFIIFIVIYLFIYYLFIYLFLLKELHLSTILTIDHINFLLVQEKTILRCYQLNE